MESYVKYFKDEQQELEKWVVLLPDLVTLFDDLQMTFHKQFKRFGKIGSVIIYDEKAERGDRKHTRTRSLTEFKGAKLDYKFPDSWVYPLFAAFRVLATPSQTGSKPWAEDPMMFWERQGEAIMSHYIPLMKELGYDHKRIGNGAYCYKAVREKVGGLYKDELLHKLQAQQQTRTPA